MSSEEEWNEQNGEDLLDEKKDDEDSEDEKMNIEEQECEQEGFIVPDDYLSVSELNLS